MSGDDYQTNRTAGAATDRHGATSELSPQPGTPMMARRDLEPALFQFDWRHLTGDHARADTQLLSECAALFSAHYGTWGPTSSRAGQRVTITPGHVDGLLSCDGASIVCALDQEKLVGYAVILKFETSDSRRVAWIAQLVVHATYRKSRIATTLMFSAWQFSDYDVWGVITANPYAIRALETATRRPCRERVIVKERGTLLSDLRRRLPYLPDELDMTDEQPKPSVDSSFPLDLSDMDEMKRGAARSDRPWNLGSIEEGHEWFAATFNSQSPTIARGEYLADLLRGADSIWIRAYEAMTLDADHAWHRHGDAEADWIVAATNVSAGARVLDAGCGDGRHAAALARRGFDVVAVDISGRLVQRASDRFKQEGVNVEVTQGDLRARDGLPEATVDVALCLYDVVGSSADPTDDRLILQNLREHLHTGGHLVLSVMSSVGTQADLRPENKPGTEEEFVSALEQLQPSRNMERSGGVFDAEFIVFYDHRYYRKEQFDSAHDLPPGEFIIRDRRFKAEEIAQLVESVGFEISSITGVRAGRWDKPLAVDDPAARELLVVARAR